MKKTLLILSLMAAATGVAAAQDFKINPDLVDTQKGLQTDLGNVEFSEIPDVKNTTDGDAKKQLADFVKTVNSASGEFAQLGGINNSKKGPQSGTFEFKRPGKFVWHTKKPYEQQVISDGKTVYQYDPDLQQVSKRAINKAVGTSPAAILFGKGDLNKSFNVEVRPEKDNMVWLRATPKVADQGFAYVDIAFANNIPAELVIRDSFGKDSTIKLRNLKTNVSLPDSKFQFKAPAGVDSVDL